MILQGRHQRVEAVIEAATGLQAVGVAAVVVVKGVVTFNARLVMTLMEDNKSHSNHNGDI